MNVKEYLKMYKKVESNKIRIVGVHPHCGRECTIVSVDDTIPGVGFRVKFDDGTGCYIYDMKNIEWL